MNHDSKFYDKWYAPKVKAGCRLLDKHKRGWWHKIKTKKLDAQSVKHCVLAQVYGSFNEGCNILAEKEGKSIDITQYGFCSEGNNPYWIKEIRKRRTRAKARKLVKV